MSKALSFKTVVAVAAILLAGGVAFLALLDKSKTSKSVDSIDLTKMATTEVKGDLTPALEKHIDRLKQAIPGTGGEPADGPGSAEAEKFLQKAYPETDIPMARLDTERAAAQNVKKRGFPTGKGKPGTWVTVGPDNALYQFTPFRSSSSYVPNKYAASGRTTTLALAGNCVPGHCRLYIAAAGGGIWRTKNALSGQPSWQYLGGTFGINAVSSIEIDSNDQSGNTIWIGTGEANASGDSAAGVGIYKSTDGGDTWTGPLGVDVFNARAVGTIAVKPGSPNVIYAASTRGVRGVSSVTGGGVTLVPGAPPWGLYKSTDGGANWTFLHNGAATTAGCDNTVNVANNLTACSPRGVRRIALDPSNPEIVYAGSYARGIWRSPDGGATWTQIFAPIANGPATSFTERPEFAVTKLPNGDTRMFVGIGQVQAPPSQLLRSDNVAAGVPVFTNLTVAVLTNPGVGSFNYCTGQCWYDNFVYTPKGYPDIVYLGGSYQYGETGVWSNGRGVVLSTDAGVSWSDMTMDATDPVHPNGLHPDQHALVTNPNNPYQFFEANDGGVARSSGQFADVSSDCDTRGLSAGQLVACKTLLSRVPTELESLNKGLPTLQFQSLSVSPHNVKILQGGTQDNGTWESDGNTNKWLQTFWGDGGQSGFDAVDPNFRFHTYFNASPDVNFNKGAIPNWIWIADLIFQTEPQAFYVPMISDPAVSRTLYVGTSHIWRTKTAGQGSMTDAEFNEHCNTITGDFAVVCGDWVPLGDPGLAGRLTNVSYGADRAGGTVAAVERASSNTGTMWTATSTGRLFVSLNADAEPASSVTFGRIDTPTTPGRFISGIYIDPTNSNRAWISYSGFSAATPATPGHVFEVNYNPGTLTATFTDLSYDLGDIAMNDVVRDDVTGDLYASSDFGVQRLVSGSTTWTLAAPGMPNVEVPGLSIVPDKRKLYAATHGLSAWLLNLK